MVSMRWNILSDGSKIKRCIQRGMRTKFTNCALSHPFMGTEAYWARLTGQGPHSPPGPCGPTVGGPKCAPNIEEWGGANFVGHTTPHKRLGHMTRSPAVDFGLTRVHSKTQDPAKFADLVQHKMCGFWSQAQRTPHHPFIQSISLLGTPCSGPGEKFRIPHRTTTGRGGSPP